MRDLKDSGDPPGSSNWPRTDWSNVGISGLAVGKDAERLDQLICAYYPALNIYFRKCFPSMGNRADELLQDFCQDRILKEGWLLKADRKRGRFRDYLKFSLRNFVLDHIRRGSKKS